MLKKELRKGSAKWVFQEYAFLFKFMKNYLQIRKMYAAGKKRQQHNI